MTEALDLDDVRRRYLELLVRGDRRGALRLGVVLIEEGVALEDLVLGVLAPAQVEVGRRWQDGRLSMSRERLATDVADTLLTLAATRSAPSDDKARLVLVLADREHHNLPARMVAELLREQGHHVTFLGTPSPGHGLERTLAKLRPDALVASVSLGMNLPGALAIGEAAHQAGVPVVAGGRGFAGVAARAGRLGLDALALRIDAVDDAAKTASTDARPAADDRAGQYHELAATRAALAAELTSRITWEASTSLPRAWREPRALRDLVTTMLQVLEAGVLCDDDVFAEWSVWLADRATALGAGRGAVRRVLGITHERLVIDAPAAGQTLHAGLRRIAELQPA